MFSSVIEILSKTRTALRCLAILALLLMSNGAAQAQPASAGTRIVNQAITTYFHNELGLLETVQSNTVEAVVSGVAALEIVGFSDLAMTRGSFDQHHFTVRNIGNVAVNGGLALDPDAENGMLLEQSLVLDVNANGVVNDADILLQPGDVMNIPAGASMQIIYGFHVAPTALLGSLATTWVRIDEASIATPTDTIENTDVAVTGIGEGRVRIVEGAFEIHKSVVQRAVENGVELTFTLDLKNDSEEHIPGYTRIGADLIVIDGEAVRGILVRDTIPLNTVLQRVGASGGFTPLYHVAGRDAQNYTSTAPQDLSTVDALAWFWPGDYQIGHSNDLMFTVMVARDLGAVTVRNTGLVYHPGGWDYDEVFTNETVTEITSDASAILEFETPYGSIGGDTSLIVIGGACNLTDAIDSVMIRVNSAWSGDVETIVATETGPNTGVFFTGPLPLADMLIPQDGDGVIATAPGDSLSAFADCSGQDLADDLPVNPGNFVFNSVTNVVVPDAVVVLYDATGAEIARTSTDARGYFSFGDVPVGSYRYDILTPYGLAFPSERMGFSGFSRVIEPDAAYGTAFSHPGGALMITDVPLDPVYDAAIGLRKSVDRTRIGTGQVVVYSLNGLNNMDQALVDAQFLDTPPRGAVFVAGSARLDGTRLADPLMLADGSLQFDLGRVAPRETVLLRYAMRFSASARPGMHINTAVLTGAQAGTGATITSPIARAEVVLDNRGGVFSREATVIGQVFLDCDKDGIRGWDDEDVPEELGVPGVRIVTQEGLTVVTDIDGKYSLFGLRPVPHAFELDARTLPKGTVPMATRATDLRRGGSRLVDLKAGELKAERFALDGCTPEAKAEIAKRRAIFGARDKNGSDRLSDLPMEAARPEPRSARSEAGIATTSHLRPADLVDADIDQTEETDPELLEEMVKTLTPEVGFVGLAQEMQVRRRSLTLRVKGPADLNIVLSLNGEPVAGSRIGERSVWEKGNVQALEYVALPLKPGRNVLELSGTDPFGIARGRAELVIVAPGDPVKIEMIAPKQAPASAGTSVPVVVRVLDAAGLPVEASSMMTLKARNAVWGVTDIRPEQPGVQVYIDNGEATFDLMAPQISGPDTLSAISAMGKAEALITWMPDLDERILVGVIEGAVALHDSNDLLDHDQLSPFEDTAHGLRGELYLKGRIKGDRLLTLRYSSDRDTEDRLFRDIRADEYYPVYGDDSERGSDAASSSNLYVKIEKGASYILYGDIAIEPESDAFKLGGYSRVTTGLKGHWENENTRVTVFAARTRQSQKIAEIAARGVSGPYDLALKNFREGSDRVEILMRDRDTGEILTTLSQQRMTDYLLDYFRGAIIFTSPVPQADDNGNPISIRVTFETENDVTERYWLYGGEAVWALNGDTEIGVRLVHADAERMTRERERIIAAFLRTKVAERTRIEAEIARAEDGFGDVGLAARVRLVHEGRRGTLTAEAVHTDEDFAPTGSSEQPGRDRLTVEYKTQLDEVRHLSARAEYIRDRISDSEILRGEVELEKSRDAQTLLRSGLRLEHDFRADHNATRLFGLLGATWIPDPDKPLTYSLDIVTPVTGGADGYMRMKLRYQLSPKLHLDAGAEIALDGHGRGQRGTHLHLALDYTMNKTLSGRTEIIADGEGLDDARLIQGFRADWNASEGLALSFGLEHSHGLGHDTDRLTSATFGLNWTSEDERWIGELDNELTFEPEGETFYANAGIAGQITPDLSFLGRARYAVDGRGDGSAHVRNRTRIGAAYRPANDPRLAVLAWYERRLEKDASSKRDTHLWSFAANYEPTADLEIRGKYAGQKETVRLGGDMTSASLVQMVQAGVDWDIADDRFRLGLQAAHIWDDAGYSTNAIGVELGTVIGEGAMLSIGYNHLTNRPTQGSSLFDYGLYVRLRLLLDSNLWDQLDRWFDN